MSNSFTTEAGVLDLLRHFKSDTSAADHYASERLAQARAIEPVLRAFEVLPTDTSRKPGPLSGIPVAIKDIFATTDMPTTNGSPIYRDHVPAADAWVVERLRNLGATIFGKTVSTEFAWRQPGPTTNPWNSRHTPGGSSSGSAAAVAAGLVPLALGSQTLGSIIRPAAFNGVVGFKPSYGAIPRRGVHPLSGSLDHIGFFARQVDDVAYALSLLAGTSDSDLHGQPVPAFEVSVAQGLQPLPAPRLAVVHFAKFAKAASEQQQLFGASITRLRSAGAVIDDLELSELDHVSWDAINIILASEAAVIFGDLVARHPDKASEHLKLLVKTGNSHSAADYLKAKAQQQRLRADFTARMAPYDAVLTLPATGEAPEGLEFTGDAAFCAPWTLMGVPAVALPAGFGRNGLPLGLQVVGPYRHDVRTLRVAKWIEATLAFQIGLPKLVS
ncbi:MAG: amidase [Hyphomicrobiales bacterium]|nr:amidase [Hyphomicrobiales bacterium]